jgi:hypothetical protein
MTRSALVVLMAVAMLLGALTWKASATPLGNAVGSLAVIEGYSAVQKAGCMFGTHRCPAGTKWVCTKYSAQATPSKKCVCRTC